jgi:hypothetical protein
MNLPRFVKKCLYSSEFLDDVMKTIFNFLSVGLLAANLLAFVQPPAIADSVRVVCRVDPAKGTSPIGMRNSFNLTQYADGNTVVSYVNFPSNANDGSDSTRVTIGSTRTLTFQNMPVAAVRKALLAKPKLYESLLGFKSERNEYKAVDALLVCKQNVLGLPKVETPAGSKERVCMINPNGENPLGNRNLLNFKQIEDGTTIVTYERLPENIRNIRARATVSSTRVLIMYDVPIESVRRAFLDKPALYDELLGFKSEDGFKAVNAQLVCE